MKHDIRLCYEQLLNESHSGHPSVIERISDGNRGRPRVVIDPDFLRFAYQHRTTAGIARFLGVSTTVVRNALLVNNISTPGVNPFPNRHNEQTDMAPADDDLLDPQLPVPETVSSERIPTQTSSNISDIDDASLDSLVIRLRVHFRRAGITMLHGMLCRLGYNIQRSRIQYSLLRVDPIHRVFQRIRIRRRVYSVAGPNALWHHDGQHGMTFCRLKYAFEDECSH